MRHIRSKDGTNIAYAQSGSGPPLLLVHGAGVDHTYWEPVTAKLEAHFTVYAADRRGRGESGDTIPYNIAREFQDVATLIDHLPKPVDVLGHSYGALCSLEAALLTKNIHKLVLYEPPVYTNINIPYPPDALERFNSYIKAGDLEKALMIVYKIGHAPANEVELQKAQPNWQARLAATPTIPREAFGARGNRFNPVKYRSFETPTMFLVGSETTPFYKSATETLHKALQNSQVVVLSGQGHEGVVTAPELFLREVLQYLTVPRSTTHLYLKEQK